MMNGLFKLKAKQNLLPTYKNYLVSKLLLDKKQVNKMFSNKEVSAAFENAVMEFYKGSNFGNRLDANLYPYIKKYEDVMEKKYGFKDNYFRYFINLYSYYSRKTYHNLVTFDNRYLFKKEKEYFSRLSYMCCAIFDNVYVDLTNNNLWWEYEDASLLRRQFLNDIVVVPLETIQELCLKYLGREIDPKELMSDTRTSPPLNLVKELDKKMAQKGYVVAYTWAEYSEKDKCKVIKNSLTNPPTNKYYLKRYLLPEKINVRDC